MGIKTERKEDEFVRLWHDQIDINYRKFIRNAMQPELTDCRILLDQETVGKITFNLMGTKSLNDEV